MMILVTGGSKCGKSRMAETIAVSCERPHYYIATMMPFGEESLAAIERHRAMRRDKGFVTVERYTDLHTLRLPDRGAALLECMGNLCANEMFSANAEHPKEKILQGIAALNAQTELLIIVTNQVGADGVTYPQETMRYIRTLGAINAALAQSADCVIEAVCGLPLVLKGEKPICL